MANNIQNFDLFEGDVFDKVVQYEVVKKSRGFNIVMSNGFVEHFSNFTESLMVHKTFCKPGGLVVVSVPNLNSKINDFFNTDEVRSICNNEVMDINYLRSVKCDGLELMYSDFYGGPFNIGLFHYQNKLLESVRTLFFGFQRLIIEPLLISLSWCNIKFNNQHTSPAIIMIYRRTK